MCGGDWIKIHRKLLESEVFDDGNEHLLRLWLWVLLQASWRTCRRGGRLLERGQFETKRTQLEEHLGGSGITWYKRLRKLEELGMVKLECNNKRTTITVCNYETYQQISEENDEKGTSFEQQLNNESLRSKEKEKEREEVYTPHPPAADAEFNRFWEVFPSRRKTGKKEAKRAWEKAVKGGADPEVVIAAAAEYAASPRGDCQYTKGPAPWLNQGCWEDDRSAWQHSDTPDGPAANSRQQRIEEIKRKFLEDE